MLPCQAEWLDKEAFAFLLDHNYAVATESEGEFTVGSFGEGFAFAGKRIVELDRFKILEGAGDDLFFVFCVDEEIALCAARFLAEADNASVGSIEIDGVPDEKTLDKILLVQ